MPRETVHCPHQQPSDQAGRFLCELGLFGGKPYIGNCVGCASAGTNTPANAARLEALHLKSHPPDMPPVSGCCDPVTDPPP